MYAALKALHISAAAISFGLFAYRGALMLADSPFLRQRWLRIVPHAVDTVLLAAGVGLAFMLRQVPGESPWLTAKLIALAIYILLGAIALRGRRGMAFFAALAVFAYIVGVAVNKNIGSWFNL
ncbi:MAG TPA: SirB2 family protein [Burkholderiales bacterium]|nr:SirB2 family protein [Burkholderiales bacterium]